jgi:hypothetical protein
MDEKEECSVVHLRGRVGGATGSRKMQRPPSYIGLDHKVTRLSGHVFSSNLPVLGSYWIRTGSASIIPNNPKSVFAHLFVIFVIVGTNVLSQL